MKELSRVNVRRLEPKEGKALFEVEVTGSPADIISCCAAALNGLIDIMVDSTKFEIYKMIMLKDLDEQMTQQNQSQCHKMTFSNEARNMIDTILKEARRNDGAE